MSASYNTVADKIRTYFGAQFDAAHPTIERFGPNQSPDPDFDDPWVALDILQGSSHQINVSPPEWRYPGIVTVSVFVPVNSGDDLSNTIIDSVAGIFRGTELADAQGTEIHFRGPDIAPGGSTEVFSMTSVNHPFHFDD